MRTARGFTAIELMVGLVILAVALLAMASMFPIAYGNVAWSGKDTAAVMLAQQRIEWLRTQAYTATALAPGTTSESLTGDYAGFTRTTTVQGDTPINGVKQITVRATGPSGRSVQLIALVAR